MSQEPQPVVANNTVPAQEKLDDENATYRHTGISRRLTLGLGSVAFAQIVSAAQAIAFVPLFLNAWGKDTYGHWLALTALVSYITLLDLGGQSYIGNLLALAYARGDMEDFREKMSQGVSLFVALGVVAVAVLATVLFVLIPLKLVPGTVPLQSLSSREIVFYSAISLLITIPGGVYITVYRAMGLFARGATVGTSVRLVEAVLYAALLLIGVSPVWFALTLAAAACTRSLIVAGDLYRNTAAPALRLSPKLAWRGRRYMRGSFTFWLISLATALNQQGALLVVAAAVGTASVAVYATHRTAAAFVLYAGNLLVGPLWPELSHLFARGERARLAYVSTLSIKAVVLASGVIGLLVWLGLPSVYAVWTGKHLHLDLVLLGIFITQVVIASGWMAAAWCLLATNHHQRLAPWSVANAVLSIVAGIAAARWWGYVGIAAASLFADLICGLAVYPVLAAGFLGIPTRSLYGAIAAPIAALLPAAVIVSLCRPFLTDWAALGGAVLLLILWVGGSARAIIGPEVWNRLIQVGWLPMKGLGMGRSHDPA